MDMEPMETVVDLDDSMDESEAKEDVQNIIEDDESRNNFNDDSQSQQEGGEESENKAEDEAITNGGGDASETEKGASADIDKTSGPDEGDKESSDDPKNTATAEEAKKAVELAEEAKNAESDEEREEKATDGDETYDPDHGTSPEKSELVPAGGDTEMVSEDELEEVEGGGGSGGGGGAGGGGGTGGSGKGTLETEEVSDEELPVSITEGLQTEAVSDEELPPLGKKRKKESPPVENKEVPSKKGKLETEEEEEEEERSAEESGGEKEKTSGKPIHPAVKSKVLPELEKYWKAVNDDPSDFTGWTYLLQYVDQESDVEAAEEAYDSFLALYPYCYGYWRKYADYEKRKGNKSKSEEVFLRGLKAIPLSVDLWLHYLNFCKSQYKEKEDHIRAEFSRALDTCGLEFRSDRLWDSFIKWEVEGKHLHKAFRLYERLLTTPTQGYKNHFEDFEDFVRSQQPNKILGADEFLSLRSEVVQKLRSKPTSGGKDVGGPPGAAPPGDEEGDIDQSSPAHADEETTLIREKIISSRKKLYKETVTAVLARWNYEEGIKRPYFHVKPLERSQLNTWREYLDFEISQGNEERTVILFERCLIACALYQEFWLKFLKYLEELPKDTSEMVREVYKRACTIHHPKKAYLALSWATFEESQGNIDEARRILDRIEENVPGILHVMVRRINLERRAGNLEEAIQLYEKYTSSNTKSKANYIALSIKFARFSWKVLKDVKKGIQLLRKALEKDSDNPRLYSQLLEMTMICEPFSEEECLKIFNEAISNDKMDLEYRKIFSQRKVEFLEDFGTSIKSLREANVEHNNIMKELRDWKKSPANADKSKTDDRTVNTTYNKGKAESQPSSNSYSNSSSTGYSGGGTPAAGAQSGGTGYSAVTTGYDPSSTGYNNQGGGGGGYGPPPGGAWSQPDPASYGQAPAPAPPYQPWGGYSQTAGYSNYNQNWPGYNYYS